MAKIPYNLWPHTTFVEKILRRIFNHIILKRNLTSKKLLWQEEYFAVSVSESQVPTVRNYIANQNEIHKTKTFIQEYNEFVDKYGFQVFDDE